MEFPVYEPSSENLTCQSYDQTTSIEEIEDQMDDWLQDSRAPKKKVLFDQLHFVISSYYCRHNIWS